MGCGEEVKALLLGTSSHSPHNLLNKGDVAEAGPVRAATEMGRRTQ